MKNAPPLSVFTLSVFFCGLIAIWGMIDPQGLAEVAKAITSSSLERFDWFFLLTCSVFIILALYLALSRFGDIKLGLPEDRPEFKTGSWLAMLFAAGMGSGLVFWGVAEPLTHFATPPPGSPADVAERARWSLVITNLHWGLHAWAIYAMGAMALGYFGFRKGHAFLASGPIEATFRGRFARAIGGLSDVLAVLSVIFGVVAALGMGTLLMTSGLAKFLGMESGSTTLSVLVLVAMTGAFMLSASTGLSKGIQILSNINLTLALVLMFFVLFVGPTHFLLSSFVTSLGDYLSNIVALSTRLFPFRDQMGWSRGWTLTYLIWWIAWAPFVGIFIARISRGRTIREFVFGVILLPTLFSALWFAVFGGAGLHVELFGSGGLGAVATGTPNEALFALFQHFPLTSLLNSVALVLMFIFLVTSADSACFVLGMMTSKGSLEPTTFRKLIWGGIMALMVIAALFSNGGTEALKALAIVGAIPFSLVMLLHCYCLLKSLHSEVEKTEGR